MRFRTASFTAALLVLASSVFAANTNSGPMHYGDYRDANACLQFMPTALDQLSRKGTRFHVRTTNAFPSGSKRLPQGLFTGDFMRHIQGVTRLQGRNTFVLSGNAAGGSYLYIAQMKSLAEEGPWKSNVRCNDTSCFSPAKDMIYKVLHLSRKFDHPGGIQSAGDFVVVGTDISIMDSKGSEIRFFDLRNPSEPAELTHLKIERPGKVRTDAVAIVKLRGGRYDGRYLIAAMMLKTRITFYLSTGTNLLDPSNRFVKYADWLSKENIKLEDYQSIQLVQQCDGELFLVGTYKSKPYFGLPWGGKDWLETYSVRLYVNGYKYDRETGNPMPLIEHYRNLHMKLKHSIFLAGAGVYVDDDTQKLLTYSTDYWPLNPLKRDTVIKFEQFAPK